MKLFEHQEQMLKFHISHSCSMDLSEVGTGKSAPAVLWLRRVISENHIKRALVIMPMTIIANWGNEIKMWSDLTSVALVGSRAKRLELLEQNVDIYLINYEGIKPIFSELLAAGFEAIICDEGHRIKNYKGSIKSPTNAFLVRELAKRARYRKLLTGTVLTNDVEDLWSLCQFVDPRIFSTNHWGFRSRYMLNKNANKPFLAWPDWQPRAGAVDEIHKLLEPYAIRFCKHEVLKFLPPVLFQRRNIELSDEQRKAYNELKKHFVTELDGATEPLAALQILGRVSKLLQICSGFAYRDDDKPYHFKQNAKLAELRNVLEEIGNQRVIIWTAFKEEVEIIKGNLGTEDFGVLTGDTKQVDRQAIVDLFNAGSLRYLVCHPACAGEGLTILAPYSVYFSRGWKLGERLQSLGRNDRPGAEQFENLTVVDLVCPGTIDDEVMAALSEKKDLLDSINPRSFKAMM